jgi:lipoprotein-anchoring transpeptidase ErfK/SrfK
LQQALAGQLGAAGQQYSQTQGNFNDLYKALAQQGVTAQNNAQQGSINMNSRVNAANAGAAPINSLSNAIAQLGTPTLPTQTPVNATGGSNTSLAQAMQSQKQTSLGNQNAAQMYNVIQDNQQPTRYGIDVNGNIFAL